MDCAADGGEVVAGGVGGSSSGGRSSRSSSRGGGDGGGGGDGYVCVLIWGRGGELFIFCSIGNENDLYVCMFPKAFCSYFIFSM